MNDPRQGEGPRIDLGRYAGTYGGYTEKRMTKLEAWTAWAEKAMGGNQDPTFTLEKSALGNAFSCGYDAGRKSAADWILSGVDLAGLAGSPEYQRYTVELLHGLAAAIRGDATK